jgi:aryl-alcohol dehydrogenase-like predicted oxidoreductase
VQTKYTPFDGQDPRSCPYDSRLPLAQQVAKSVAVSLSNLQSSYIDSLVLHSPLRTHEETMTVWRAFEAAVASGQVRQLGISNCYDLARLKQVQGERVACGVSSHDMILSDTPTHCRLLHVLFSILCRSYGATRRQNRP